MAPFENKETSINLGTGETYLHNKDSMNGQKKTGTPDRLNSVFIYKRGTVGGRLNFMLLDENRAPVRLVRCAVMLTAQKKSQPPFLDSLPCQISPNQHFASAGSCEFVFDEDAAMIPAGEYDLEITVIWEDGNTLKFPNSIRMPFGKLIVREGLR